MQVFITKCVDLIVPRTPTTTSTIFNEEMNDIMKMVKSLNKSGSLIKGIRHTINK